MKRFVAAVLGVALVAVVALAGDTGIVKGRVVNEKGEGVSDVQVVLDSMAGTGQKFTTKTNKKGEYVQIGVRPGMWAFTATKEGLASKPVEFKVTVGDENKVPDIKLLAAAAAAGPGKAQLAFDKVNKLAAAGDLDGAIAAMDEVLASNPGRPEVAHYRLGQLQYLKGDLTAAEAAYRKSLEAKPGYLDAIRGMVDTLAKGRRGDEAIALVQKYTAENPGDSEGHYLLGFTLHQLGKPQEAEPAFAKVLELDPTNADAHYFMGVILVAQNKVPEALASLQKYVDSNPSDGQNLTTAKQLIAALSPKK